MPKAKSYLFFLAFFLLFAKQPLFGQEEFHHRTITSEQGLSQSEVNCILQDHRGFMWFGTQDGLNCYDGNGVTIYKTNPLDSNSLPTNFINSLFEDTHGILWIGTDGGLSTLNLHTGKFTNYLHVNSYHPDKNNIRTIFEDKAGTIWVGTDYNSLCKFDKATKKFTTYPLTLKDTNSSSFDYVSSITADVNGELWIGSFGGGVYNFNTTTKKTESFYQAVEARTTFDYINNVSSVYYEKEKNELLVGTKGMGLETFSITSKKFTHFYTPTKDTINPKQPRIVWDITKNKTGTLWVAGNNGEGLFSFDEATRAFTSYKHSHPGSSIDFNENFCNCLYVSNENILWVGTNGGVGYYIPEKRNFIIYKDTVNRSANTVMSIAKDAGGKLWIGTNGAGLRIYDEITHTYSQDDALSNAIQNISIISLFIDKEDNLWIGTWGSGVIGYNLLSEKIIKIDSLNIAIAKTSVTNITQDHTGKIWIATYDKGVFVYDEKQSTIDRITVNNGLSDNHAYSFMENKDYNMWICTDGGGINCYSADGKISVIKKTPGSNSLSSNTVNCMYEDTEGNLWIGTSVGLNKYIKSQKRFVHYFVKDGLPNDYIYNILPDKNGDLWISTNKGISRFSPNAPNESGSAFKNFSVGDGLPSNEYNQGACIKTADGQMYFGSTNGIVSFTPEKVTGNLHEPPVSITSCELFGKEYLPDTLISEKKHLVLSWKNNTISFSFIGLDYEMPSENKYKYMLEGADADWSPPTTHHWANYMQLPPGHYVFRVKACNNDGVWSPEGASIVIDIIPPFWKTKWFYALCVILILAGIYSFIKYRTSLVEKEKRVLEIKVEERTHELAQKNKDITSSIQYAKRIQQAILPPLEEIKQYLPESFVLYLPKDIVSGDFYWFGEQDNKLIMVAADCTGHGVPGALMSMIGHNLLNQIVLEKGITTPATILNNLNTMVQTALKQGVSTIDTTDGMDVALCSFNKLSGEVEYAGANRPLIIAGSGEIKKIDPDKMPIGGSQIGLARSFTNHVYKVQPGETVYMFSDGYADQFGGEKGKKFMIKRFLEKLQEIKHLPMQEQESILLNTILAWRGDFEQVDDILVIGIKYV